MSFDLYLKDPVTHETLQLDEPHQMKGGTYAVGGTTDCHLNVTYNYSPHFKEVGPDGLRSLSGMTGAESIPLLKGVAAKLKDDKHPDYWEATEGNAKAALLQLVALAQMRPDGIWEVD